MYEYLSLRIHCSLRALYRDCDVIFGLKRQIWIHYAMLVLTQKVDSYTGKLEIVLF